MNEDTIYEVWGDVESGIGTTVSTQAGIRQMKENGLLDVSEQPLYSLRASSWNEVMTYHCEHNGWEPYEPAQ